MICVGGGYNGVAPEFGSMRQLVGVGEMGLGGEIGLLPRTSGLGALRKTPKFKPNTLFWLFWLVPKRCILDPTWTIRLTWHLPK
jgi:hypothetical protein